MAYVIKMKPHDISKLVYLPLKAALKSGEMVQLQVYDSEKHEAELYSMFSDVIHEGNSYPQETTNLENFRLYYTCMNVFVCIRESTGEVLGSFYVKPNFPDRCSHICNSGFLVKSDFRGQGLGKLITKWFLYVARDLGYEASFFNLVFESNHGACHIYDQLEFKMIGVIPNAGKLKGHGYVNARQYYYDLTTLTGSPNELTGN